MVHIGNTPMHTPYRPPFSTQPAANLSFWILDKIYFHSKFKNSNLPHIRGDSMPYSEDKHVPEDYYHNTQLLLRNYRSARWNLELELSQICDSTPMDFGTSVEDRLLSIEGIGVSYYGIHLQSQASNVRLTWQMIQYIDKSIALIRSKHPQGQLYYQILYCCYLSEEGPLALPELMKRLQQHGFFISTRSFYRRRKEAVTLLGSVLWGYTSKECLDVLQQYMQQLQSS